MMDSLRLMRCRALESIGGRMARFTEASGGRMRCVATEYSNGQTVELILANSKIIIRAAMVSSNQIKVDSIADFGKMEEHMV